MARALGLDSFVRPLLTFRNDYYDSEEEDSDGEVTYGKSVTLVGDDFHEFKLRSWEIEQDSRYVQEMQDLYPSRVLDRKQVTWLNERDRNLQEPALAHVTVGWLRCSNVESAC